MTWVLGFVWGLVVLASLFGWGHLVARVFGQRDADLGLLGGWGMAAVCVLGGVLVGAGWATQSAVLGMVAVGVMAALAAVSTSPRAGRPRAQLLLCLLVLLLHYAFYVSTASLDCADDLMAYLPQVERMLATGSMDEPFSLRRLAAFGGHSVLQAMVLAVADHPAYALAERGLPPFLVYGLGLGLLRDAPLSPTLRHGVALLLSLGMMAPPINHHSHQTGLVAFLTLARSLQAGIALPALLAAAVLSLRAHYLIGLAVFMPIALYRRPLPAAVLRATAIGGLALLLLLPWMWALMRSSGTPYYPLLPGHAAYGYQILSAPLTPAEHLRFAAGFLLSEHAALLLIATVLAALGRSRPAAALAAAGWLTAAAFLAKFTYASYWDFGRYVYPMPAAATVLGAAAVLHRFGAKLQAGQRLVAMAAAIAALAIVARHGMLARHALPAPDAAETAALRQAQQVVPAGARLAVAVNAPYLLDYRRNDAVSLDYPGAAGPAPGLPLNQGADALADYLRVKGNVRYLLTQDMATRYACLWLPTASEPATGAAAIFRDALLAFEANVDDLERRLGARRFGAFRVIALNGSTP